ncbi:MAG TPA: hypothetical protein ENJ06_05045, partial [Phycisphaeraceae bacterium]|nr:hypothetical protein [Phycisphaeraceae bacterium]
RAKERVRETDPLKKMSLRSLEERIEKIQFDISEIDRKLADPENYRNAELLKQLAAQRDEFAKKLVPLEDEWVRRAEAEDV